MKRYQDWPKSPFLAAMRPSRPIYFSTPLWRGQFALLSKIADNVACPTPDMVTYAALAYVAQFRTKRELLAALKEAQERYAVRGETPQLGFRLGWPDTPWALASRKTEAALYNEEVKNAKPSITPKS